MELKKINLVDGREYTIRDHRHRFFYPQEWFVFEDALREKQKFTYGLLINTGARINEARHITPYDIDFERLTIRLVKTKVRASLGEKKPVPRTIPISSAFSKYLKKRIRDFDLKDDQYLPLPSTSAANITMKNTLKRIGIKDWQMFSIHNIRKTTETWLIALNVDSLKVAMHMGHSLSVAQKHYVSPDIFTNTDKDKMRDILGDLYRR